MQKGNTDAKLTQLFTTFTANDPQYLVKIDRDKAKSLQVPLSQITDALQVYMGSVYVNDFTSTIVLIACTSRPTSNIARNPRTSASIMYIPIPGR